MACAPTARSPDAGLTLIEMLVVLVLVGILAGTVSLSVGRLGTGPSLAARGDTLASRLRIAAETAALTGRDAALSWGDDGYRFLSLTPDGWTAHPLAELGRIERLPGDVDFAVAGDRRGSLRIPSDLIPPDPAPLTALLTKRGRRVEISFDGLYAWSREVGP